MLLTKFQKELDALGVVTHGANLAAGTIYWTNAMGVVVAHAKIKAILSWAATNNSAMWAHAIGQFEDAHVPVIIPPNAKGDYIGNINDEQAATLAAAAAEGVGAEFVYRAANGANGLYLAIFDFKAEAIVLSAEDIARKKRSVMSYNVQMLSNLAEILNHKKRIKEAIGLMEHYRRAMDEHLQHVAGDDQNLKEALIKQQKSLRVWEEMLPKGRKDVLAFMKQAASKWSRIARSYT